jgi:hypothetical protein
MERGHQAGWNLVSSVWAISMGSVTRHRFSLQPHSAAGDLLRREQGMDNA